MHKLIVITGLDGTGTSTIAKKLHHKDAGSLFLQTPTPIFSGCRDSIDRELRTYSLEAHYHFYLASVIHASQIIRDHLPRGNVYTVRYLLDTIVSHRVGGMSVELCYETNAYCIYPPDFTFLLTIPEEDRQKRLAGRPEGKGELDKLLDDDCTRAKFLSEFDRYKTQWVEMDNSADPEFVVESIRKQLSFI